jgi:hypothetical protein
MPQTFAPLHCDSNWYHGADDGVWVIENRLAGQLIGAGISIATNLAMAKALQETAEVFNQRCPASTCSHKQGYLAFSWEISTAREHRKISGKRVDVFVVRCRILWRLLINCQKSDRPSAAAPELWAWDFMQRTWEEAGSP